MNYLTVGPVYGGLPMGDAGLALVRHAAKVAPPSSVEAKPWFAVGGITAGNLDEVLDAGARRIAVSRAVTDADDPEAAAMALKDRLRHALERGPGHAEPHLQDVPELSPQAESATGSGAPRATRGPLRPNG